jgi:hypothetical protein
MASFKCASIQWITFTAVYHNINHVFYQVTQTCSAAIKRKIFPPTIQLQAQTHHSWSQHVRRYASEAPKSGGSNTLLYTLGGVGLAGAGYYAFAGGKKDPVAAAKELTEASYENKTPAQGGPPDKVFIGGGKITSRKERGMMWT